MKERSNLKMFFVQSRDHPMKGHSHFEDLLKKVITKLSVQEMVG